MRVDVAMHRGRGMPRDECGGRHSRFARARARASIAREARKRRFAAIVILPISFHPMLADLFPLCCRAPFYANATHLGSANARQFGPTTLPPYTLLARLIVGRAGRPSALCHVLLLESSRHYCRSCRSLCVSLASPSALIPPFRRSCLQIRSSWDERFDTRPDGLCYRRRFLLALSQHGSTAQLMCRFPLIHVIKLVSSLSRARSRSRGRKCRVQHN